MQGTKYLYLRFSYNSSSNAASFFAKRNLFYKSSLSTQFFNHLFIPATKKHLFIHGKHSKKLSLICVFHVIVVTVACVCEILGLKSLGEAITRRLALT